LELVFVLIRQRSRPVEILRRSLNLVLDAGEGISQAILD
jgi:hypothetical protein